MSKILIALAVGAIAVFSLAAQPAQARHCSGVVATAPGLTQGIATTRAQWRRQRYVNNHLSGWSLRKGPRNSCEGWGVGDRLRPICKSGAVYCS
jgi:hypothetical protein